MAAAAVAGEATQEILRILRPGGTALFYVWALEQEGRTFTSQDNLVPWSLQARYTDDGTAPRTLQRYALAGRAAPVRRVPGTLTWEVSTLRTVGSTMFLPRANWRPFCTAQAT